MVEEFNSNTKLEIAVEILAKKIAMVSETENDEKLQIIIEERNEMYKGNEKIINKIIKEYGPEIKKSYEIQKNV